MSSKNTLNYHNVHEWTVQDVANWLRAKNYNQYLDLFIQQKIDGTVLLTLNEKDLRKPPLSIETLGDVKKLYLSISTLQTINVRVFSGNDRSLASRNPEYYHLKEQIRNDLRYSGLLPRSRRTGSNSRFTSSTCLDDWSDLQNSPNQMNDEMYDEEDDDEGMEDFKILRLKHGEYLQFRPEAWKALVAMAYFFAVTWITAIVMVIVHERVPDMQTYPPLPDIFLDNVPLIPGAFMMCELCGLTLFILMSLLLIFHKHRFILIRRFFSLFGSVFLLRCVTMLITSLSVPGRHLDCKARHNGDWLDKLTTAFLIWQNGGMSIRGVRTCGDYMFSGHTVVLTLLNFFITEYTPRSLYFVHTLSWVLNLFGVFFILAGHEHYSIDVFIAFYISTRLFLYYHTLANNRALYQRDRKRTRIWFPLFYFFESGVNGMVPNHFEIPFKGLLARWKNTNQSKKESFLNENDYNDKEEDYSHIKLSGFKDESAKKSKKKKKKN